MPINLPLSDTNKPTIAPEDIQPLLARLFPDFDPADTSPKVYVFDGLPLANPQDMAMVQSMYSRDPNSFVTRLERVLSAGSGKFMQLFYVGYGHRSIGDCGTTTVFLEHWSMLAAKAMQDHFAYSGQEASTRYLDFGTLPLRNPLLGTDEAAEGDVILADTMALYQRTLSSLMDALKAEYPLDGCGDIKPKQWENAIAARAFDIAGSLLPLGTTTFFSVAMNLRQFRDKLTQLATHPLAEVQHMAKKTHKALSGYYPESFKPDDVDTTGNYADLHAWNAEHTAGDHLQTAEDVLKVYQLGEAEVAELKAGKLLCDTRSFFPDLLEKEGLQTRPRHGYSKRWQRAGSLTFVGLMDFRSYRDLQRHRGGWCPVPLVNSQFSFEPAYFQEMDALLGAAGGDAVREHMAELLVRINNLSCTPEQRQYFFPMGMRCLYALHYGLAQAIYVSELRSGKDVHFTLRPHAQQMAKHLQTLVPEARLYVDDTPSTFSLSRGNATITSITPQKSESAA